MTHTHTRHIQHMQHNGNQQTELKQKTNKQYANFIFTVL